MNALFGGRPSWRPKRRDDSAAPDPTKWGAGAALVLDVATAGLGIVALVIIVGALAAGRREGRQPPKMSPAQFAARFADGALVGSKAARARLLVFYGFDCRDCITVHRAIDRALLRFPEHLQVSWHVVGRSTNALTRELMPAIRCAAQHGDFHSFLHAAEAHVLAVTEPAGNRNEHSLDMPLPVAMAACAKEEEARAIAGAPAVSSDDELGALLPLVFLNGQLLSHGRSSAYLDSAIGGFLRRGMVTRR